MTVGGISERDEMTLQVVTRALDSGGTETVYTSGHATAYVETWPVEEGGGSVLAWIEVHGQRGVGHGSQILARVLADADEAGRTLTLQIQPSGAAGGLGAQEIRAWYGRHGFTDHLSGMIREPAGAARGRRR